VFSYYIVSEGEEWWSGTEPGSGGWFLPAAMGDYKQTVVCSFDPSSPRLTAYEVHEWIHDQLKVLDDTVTAVQIDASKRLVYVRFVDQECASTLVQRTNGTVSCKHATGEISTVNVDLAGLGFRRVRIVNVPLGVGQERFRIALMPYGEVKTVQEEHWSKNYRYAVVNGVRIVHIALKRHIPSHLFIDAHRALIAYDGQPTTCYQCAEPGHLYQGCPKRRAGGRPGGQVERRAWADVVATGEQGTRPDDQLNSVMLVCEGGEGAPEANQLTQAHDVAPEEEMVGLSTSSVRGDEEGGAVWALDADAGVHDVAADTGSDTDEPVHEQEVDHQDEPLASRAAGTPAARKKGTGKGGKGGVQSGGPGTGKPPASPGPERGADLSRTKKRLDRSDEALAGWKRTRIKGGRSTAASQ
jgi:hypothetical protein